MYDGETKTRLLRLKSCCALRVRWSFLSVNLIWSALFRSLIRKEKMSVYKSLFFLCFVWMWLPLHLALHIMSWLLRRCACVFPVSGLEPGLQLLAAHTHIHFRQGKKPEVEESSVLYNLYSGNTTTTEWEEQSLLFVDLRHWFFFSGKWRIFFLFLWIFF